MEIRFEGLDRLARKFERLSNPAVVQQTAKKGIMKGSLLVEGDAKDLCAVDTGRLRNSINSKTEIHGDTIESTTGTNVEYGPYLEFGTGQRGASSPQHPGVSLSFRSDWKGMSARPYLYPALIQNRQKILELVADEFKAEIRRLGG